MSDELDALFDELDEKVKDSTEVDHTEKNLKKREEDFNKTYSKTEKPKKGEIDQVLKTIKKNDKGKGMKFDTIVKKSKLKGIIVEKCIFNLLLKGNIYEPKPGIYAFLDDDNNKKEEKKESIDDLIDSIPVESSKPEEKPKSKPKSKPKPDETDLDMNDILGVDVVTETALSTTKSNEFGAIISEKDIPEALMINLYDKPYITKAGLLWLGKKAGVYSIETEAKENSWENDSGRAVYKATVIMKNGGHYVSTGIAIPDGKNVENKRMFRFIDHLAETRAVNRALRMATNCGFVSAEEMPTYKGDLN